MARKLDPIIIFVNGEGLLDVAQNGKVCCGLAYDEMIGQVISLTRHLMRPDGYPMMTPEEWAIQRQARFYEPPDISPPQPATHDADDDCA